MKVAVIFDRFGPYHLARLTAASKQLSIASIELFGHSVEYQWERVIDFDQRYTLFTNHSNTEISSRKLFVALQQLLDEIKPEAVAINGWSDRGALSALYWCLKNKVAAVVMSDSTAYDEKRLVWKEWIKSKVVKLFGSALVAGIPHVSYIKNLGLSATNIFTGYDVVDNQFFFHRVHSIRHNEVEKRYHLHLPKRFVLANCRFVKKKNLPFLIKAFAQYRKLDKNPFDLVIVGDGEEKEMIKNLLTGLNLQSSVHLPGFKQYSELPYYYAFASFFVHASTTEQWGLVVNEAMAAGLPVLVSERCGCVPDLVENGVNGFSFNPYAQQELIDLLLKMSDLDDNGHLTNMGLHSQKIISNWQPSQFADSLHKAVKAAKASPLKNANRLEKLLLKSLIYR